MFIIDAACQNAFSLYRLKCNSINKTLYANDAKQNALEEIGMYPVKSNVRARINTSLAHNNKYLHDYTVKNMNTF